MSDTTERLTWKAEAQGFEETGRKFQDLYDTLERLKKQGPGSLAPHELNLVGNALLGMGAAGATAFGLIAKESLQAAMYIERAETAFAKFLGSRRAAQQFNAELMQFAKQTPFTFQQLVGLSQNLLASGFKRQEITPFLTDLGDAVAALGGTGETLDRLVLAMRQVKAAGRLMGQDLLQIAQANVPVYDILQKELGLTGDQLRDVGNAGISAEKFFAAFSRYVKANYGGYMAEQMKTAAGKVSNLEDALFQLEANIGKQLLPVFKPMLDGLSGVIGWMSSLDPATVRAALGLSGVAIGFVLVYGALLKVAAYQAIVAQATAARAAADIAANEAEAASANAAAAAYGRMSRTAGLTRWVGRAAGAAAAGVAGWQIGKWAAQQSSPWKQAAGGAGAVAGGAALGAMFGGPVGAVIGAITGLTTALISLRIAIGAMNADTERQEKEGAEYRQWLKDLPAADRRRYIDIQRQMATDQQQGPPGSRMSDSERQIAAWQQLLQEKQAKGTSPDVMMKRWGEWVDVAKASLERRAEQGAQPEEIAALQARLARGLRAYSAWAQAAGDTQKAVEADTVATKLEREARLGLIDARLESKQQSIEYAKATGADASTMQGLTEAYVAELRQKARLLRALGDLKGARSLEIEALNEEKSAREAYAQEQRDFARLLTNSVQRSVEYAKMQGDPNRIFQTTQALSNRKLSEARLLESQANLDERSGRKSPLEIGAMRDQAQVLRMESAQLFSQAREGIEQAVMQTEQEMRNRRDLRAQFQYGGTPLEHIARAQATYESDLRIAQDQEAMSVAARHRGNPMEAARLANQAAQTRLNARETINSAARRGFDDLVRFSEQTLKFAESIKAPEDQIRAAKDQVADALMQYATYLRSIGDVLGANEAELRALEMSRKESERGNLAAQIIGGELSEFTRGLLSRLRKVRAQWRQEQEKSEVVRLPLRHAGSNASVASPSPTMLPAPGNGLAPGQIGTILASLAAQSGNNTLAARLAGEAAQAVLARNAQPPAVSALPTAPVMPTVPALSSLSAGPGLGPVGAALRGLKNAPSIFGRHILREMRTMDSRTRDELLIRVRFEGLDGAQKIIKEGVANDIMDALSRIGQGAPAVPAL